MSPRRAALVVGVAAALVVVAAAGVALLPRAGSEPGPDPAGRTATASTRAPSRPASTSPPPTTTLPTTTLPTTPPGTLVRSTEEAAGTWRLVAVAGVAVTGPPASLELTPIGHYRGLQGCAGVAGFASITRDGRVSATPQSLQTVRCARAPVGAMPMVVSGNALWRDGPALTVLAPGGTEQARYLLVADATAYRLVTTPPAVAGRWDLVEVRTEFLARGGIGRDAALVLTARPGSRPGWTLSVAGCPRRSGSLVLGPDPRPVFASPVESDAGCTVAEGGSGGPLPFAMSLALVGSDTLVLLDRSDRELARLRRSAG